MYDFHKLNAYCVAVSLCQDQVSVVQKVDNAIQQIKHEQNPIELHFVSSG